MNESTLPARPAVAPWTEEAARVDQIYLSRAGDRHDTGAALAPVGGSFHRSTMSAAGLNELLRLPKRERLKIAERLWLSVADDASMPVAAAHKRVLKKRLADYKSGASQPIPHDELMRRVRAAT